MAKSLAWMAESPVRLLTAKTGDFSSPYTTEAHQHAFWQLDHCGAGAFEVTTGTRTFRLRKGQGVLLPPGTPHAIRYPRGSGFISWKFTWDGGPLVGATILDRQAGWAGLALALAAGPVAPAVPLLLNAAVHIAGAGDLPPAGGIAATIAELLSRHPAAGQSVAAVAAGLGLSPGHVSARFKAERGLPLKRWLDTRRAERAAWLLVHTTDSIAAIAQAGGFDDAFVFSRFFRRITGESPSRFRRRDLDQAH